MNGSPEEPPTDLPAPTGTDRGDGSDGRSDIVRRLGALEDQVTALAAGIERHRPGPATKGLGCLAILMLFYIAANMGILRGLLREVLLKLP